MSEGFIESIVSVVIALVVHESLCRPFASWVVKAFKQRKRKPGKRICPRCQNKFVPVISPEGHSETAFCEPCIKKARDCYDRAAQSVKQNEPCL